MGSYASKGPMDDLISQMKETDSQLSLLEKQIKRHEDYGDAWNDDENLNYFHMLEQQDDLKKKKNEQEEQYRAAINQTQHTDVSPTPPAGIKPKEIDRIWDAINSTDTRSNPYISDDDLMANQTRLDALNSSDKELEDLLNAGKKTVGVPTYEMTRTSDALAAINQAVNQGKNSAVSDDDILANITRLDALRWQAEHPGVKQYEVDRVYDAVKNTDTQKNPYISDDDLMANLNRLEALGGSIPADTKQQGKTILSLEDIPNRQYTEINRIITGDMFEKYLKQMGKTYGELRTDAGMRYGELLKGLSARERSDAVTQIVAQDALDWGAETGMEDGGNKSVENQSGGGYNGSGSSSGKGSTPFERSAHWVWTRNRLSYKKRLCL